MELLKDLGTAAKRSCEHTFREFLQDYPPSGGGDKTVWDLHDDYEMALVDRMVRELEPV